MLRLVDHRLTKVLLNIPSFFVEEVHVRVIEILYVISPGLPDLHNKSIPCDEQ